MIMDIKYMDMRKYIMIAIVALTAACATSCLEGSMKYNYPLTTSFEYQQFDNDKDFFKGKSYFDKMDFVYDVMMFTGTRNEADSSLIGGFALAYVCDSVLVTTVDGVETPRPEEDIDPYTAFLTDTLAYKTVNHFTVYTDNRTEGANPEKPIVFAYAGQEGCSCAPQSCFVVNTTYSALRLASEEATASVEFTGYAGGAQTGSVSLDLKKDGKPLSLWTKVDLTPLGNIDYIVVNVKSNDDKVNMVAIDHIYFNINIEY